MARQDSLGGYDEDRFKDKVDIKLQCSVCLKVLKDPVQCSNEHYFCRSCICKSLRENSEACPMCNHHLTEENLTKAPRILMDFLQSLEIRCDHENRGCQEFIKLEFLDSHVNSCDYSPTTCTNTGCAQVINQNEKERHEREQCEFRKIVCDECGEQVIWKSSRVHPCFMRKEMDELARRLNVVQNDVGAVQNDVRNVQNDVGAVQNDVRDVQNDVGAVQNDVRNVQNDVGVVQNDVRNVQNDVGAVKEKVERVEMTQEEMAYLTKEAIERCNLFTGRQKIFVLGGYNKESCLNSVESYSWPENSWTLEPAMKEKRSSASAFVHGREIYVSGGWNWTENANSIESLKVDEENLEWMQSGVTMSIKCRRHKIIRHRDSAILTGGLCDGDNVSDGIYELSLNPPHNTKLLTQMPEQRCSHGCEIIDNQVIVAGGRTSSYFKDTKNTVYAYDLNNNECKTLPPLPLAVSGMATVSYKDNVVLIGGVNEKGETLNSVVMYDVKTEKVKMLPCLNYKRSGSSAVITGNVIIVMGGVNFETKTQLNSVEYLDLNTSAWRELSPMTTKRAYACAVVKPLS